MEFNRAIEIEALTEAYNLANDALKASPLYAAKEAAGAALQAAHMALKAERQAQRAAAHAARGTVQQAVEVAASVVTNPVVVEALANEGLRVDTEELNRVMVLSHETGEL